MTHTASSNVPYGALPKNVSGAGIVEHGRIFLVFFPIRLEHKRRGASGTKVGTGMGQG